VARSALATLAWSPTTPGTATSPPFLPPETTRVTALPWRSLLPGPGDWRTTRPLGWALASCRTSLRKPACDKRALAASCDRPTTSGTPTSGGAGGRGAAGNPTIGWPARAACM
jgi:hypothetical protein